MIGRAQLDYHITPKTTITKLTGGLLEDMFQESVSILIF